MEALERFLAQLEIERNVSPNTLRAYRSDLQELLAYAARDGRRAEEVDHRFLRRYIALLNTKRYSRRTVARKLSAARTFYRFLLAGGAIETNPASLLSAPRAERLLPKALKPEVVQALLSAPDPRRPLGQRDAAILETLYAGGLRVGELVGLDVGDADLRAGELTVMGKGSKERVVLVGSCAVNALARYLAEGRVRLSKEKGCQALFLNKSGERMSTNAVRNLLSKYVAQVSASRAVTPHVLRHTFATHLLENGADLRAVQELLGHVDLSSTQIYTHLGAGRLKQVHEQSHPRA
ncbi:MAG: tyrosine recombinase XerC [Actinobacteria bacterium]|nr:MAG: tyrosine recombinase XerC [Actinomycetota bacterium]